MIDLEPQGRTLGTRLTSTSGQAGASVSMKASGTHRAQAAWHHRPQRIRSSAPSFVGHSTQAGAVALPGTNETLRLRVTRPETPISAREGAICSGLVGARWQAHSLSLLHHFPFLVPSSSL